MSDDTDNVIHVTFNPRKQTEADKIDIDLINLLTSGSLEYDTFIMKRHIEDFLALGYDDFTAHRLAKELCKKGRN